MVAAALWALDALIRTQLTFRIPSASIVFMEHLIAFIFLLPFFIKGINSYKKLNVKDWGVALLMTIVSSVLGTVLFTEALSRSFAVFDFATPLLLQKLQPIFVIGLSAIILREKLTLRFIALTVIALIGSYMISFGAEPLALQIAGKEEIFLLAIGAALAWGSGTIMSKHLLTKLSFSEATALRFLLAIPISLFVSYLINQQYDFTQLGRDDIARFVIIAFSTGAASILIYYRGLKVTQAKVATIAELTFPIVGILIAVSSLNPYGEPQKMILANVFGIVILLISIILISFDYDEEQKNKR